MDAGCTSIMAGADGPGRGDTSLAGCMDTLAGPSRRLLVGIEEHVSCDADQGDKGQEPSDQLDHQKGATNTAPDNRGFMAGAILSSYL